MAADRTPKVLFSTPKRSKVVRHYKQADCELAKIDIHCHVQGDVVLECISLDSDLEREQMMFRIMFNTAFIRSNILMLNRDEIDTLWNDKDQFPKDFRVEILFSDMDASSSVISIDMPRIEDKEGLPIEAFAKVQEIFSNVDWLDSKTEVVNVLQQITASNKLQEIFESGVSVRPSNLPKDSLSGRFNFDPTTLAENDISNMTSTSSGKVPTSYESSPDPPCKKKMEPLETKVLSENNKITTSSGHAKQFVSPSDLSTDSNLAKKIISLESKASPENDTENLTLKDQGNQFLPLELPMDALESKTLLENDAKFIPAMVQEKKSILLTEPSMEAKSMGKKFQPLESKPLPDKNTKSLTSSAQAKESSLSHKPSDDANSLKKMIETSETMALSEDNTKSLTSAAQTKESIPSHEPSADPYSLKRRIEPQHLQVALQLPTQSKIISPRVRQASQSVPVLYCSSSQGSPLPISRYPSAPSALGITALLQDRTEGDIKKEVNHGVTVPSSSSTLSPSVLGVPKSVSPTSVPPVSSSTLLRSLALKSLMDVTAVTHNTVAPLGPAVSSPSPPQPQPTSGMMQPIVTQNPENIAPDKTKKSLVPPTPALQSQSQHTSELTQRAVTQHPENIAHEKGEKSLVSPLQTPYQPQLSSGLMQPIVFQQPENITHDKSKKSLISPPAPLPSLPEVIKSSISTPSHPTAAPLSPSSLKSSFSTTLSPPPASQPSSSFPETCPHSTVKNSFKGPPPPPPAPHSAAAPLPSPSCTKSSLSTRPPPPPLPPPPSPSPLTSQSTVNGSSASPLLHPSLPHTTPVPLAPSSMNSSFSPAPSPAPAPRSPHSTSENSLKAPPPPPPPPSLSSTAKAFSIPPPPLSGIPSSAANLNPSPLNMNNSAAISGPPPPPPPPGHSGTISGPTLTSTVPPPPLPPASPTTSLSKNSATVPPPPSANGLSKAGTLHPGTGNGNIPPAPGPPSVPGPPTVPFGAKGRGLSRPNAKIQTQTKRSNLKPYHWLKLTRVMHGSLWAETQKPEEASKAPEFDMSELESLFSAATPNSDRGSKGGKSNRLASGTKTEKVQLIELRRAYNCEIMLTKVKIPLPDLVSSVLALDDSALDADQVENLIKFCPTKEEMELLRNYTGDKGNLGRCEQFFLELMKVPRVERKLRVFSFKIQFGTQVSELRRDLNIVNSASEEIRSSVKLKRIMQTILSLGNALNHGTARGAAIGFRLDSLLKLTDTRARNNKMTLMHYLCKVLAEKLPELLDFSKDLESLEASTKIQLKYLAEEMQAISKGLEKVVQELTVSENDGPVSENFCKILKEFLSDAEAEVRSLAQLYSNVGRNADALAQYFGEDPARCPFEQVVSTLLNFVRMFERAHEDNCKQLEFERKKAMKEAENEKLKLTPKKESEQTMRTPIESGNIK
ncbi:formin-like protein 18 [Neltuma alba]|uniref:formin-like protein 18 n=1 Tax=Neltuma alba TaxID=207710 RepID=UPI0010A4CB18|nr:formin-like protein 18 [Prosopis alba]